MDIVGLGRAYSMSAESDQFFDHRTDRLGFGNGCSDAFVLYDTAREVGDHRVAMVRFAAQFTAALKMAHNSVKLQLDCLGGRLKQ